MGLKDNKSHCLYHVENVTTTQMRKFYLIKLAQKNANHMKDTHPKHTVFKNY